MVPNLLKKIDPIFFKKSKDCKNWYEFKKIIENFLEENGVKEDLDIDVVGIHNE